MTDLKPVLVSGVKPTGDLHIGNYFGAMRQFVELTKEGKYRPFIFVADYHALNTMQDAEEMKRRIREIVMAYLAIGLNDPWRRKLPFLKRVQPCSSPRRRHDIVPRHDSAIRCKQGAHRHERATTTPTSAMTHDLCSNKLSEKTVADCTCRPFPHRWNH